MVTYGYPTKMAELRDFDYFVYTPFTVSHYRQMRALEGNELLENLSNERYLLKVFQSGGNIVYKIVH
jgi:hypothetical protein